MKYYFIILAVAWFLFICWDAYKDFGISFDLSKPYHKTGFFELNK